MKYVFPAFTSLLAASQLGAAPLQSAKVTKVYNDVRIFKPAAAAKAASIGDVIRGQTSLQTGRRSRSELKFQDNTITRIGANSIFSFEQGTRDLRLEQGTLLLQVPKNAGGATIRTATVTAAVTGTTIMMEFFSKKWVKIIVLEGTLNAWIERLGKRTKRSIRAGQMIVLRANDSKIPKPVEIDLKRLIKTSGLMDQENFGPLPGPTLNKINTAIKRQDDLVGDGTLAPVVPEPKGPLNPGSDPADRATETRDDVNDVVEPPPITEGDDPGGSPSGGNQGGEGDDPG